MEIFAISDSATALQSLSGFTHKPLLLTNFNHNQYLSFEVSAASAPPTIRPDYKRPIHRTFPRKKPRTKRRLLTDDVDDGIGVGDGDGYFFGVGGDGDGGAVFGYGGDGAVGGGKGWSYSGGGNGGEEEGERTVSWLLSLFYQVLCSIALLSCMVFAYKKIVWKNENMVVTL